MGILEESAYSKAEMYAYDKFWDQVSIEATYQRDWEGTIAERDAAVEKLHQTVRQMRAGGMSVEMIAKFTGMTIAEINGIG